MGDILEVEQAVLVQGDARHALADRVSGSQAHQGQVDQVLAPAHHALLQKRPPDVGVHLGVGGRDPGVELLVGKTAVVRVVQNAHIEILVPSLSPPPTETAGTAAASPPERKGTEAATQSAVEIYRELIKENIEYDHLLHYSKIDPEELDGIVELLVETVCTARKTIRVAGDDYPAELVKAKLLKLNSGHIEFVMDCMRENTTKIRNMKKYLLAVLFNAPSTMGSYYTALVAHDMAEGKI